jgi:antitoxin CptB
MPISKPLSDPTPDPTGDALDLRRRRAVYRAEHRGTKEMDWMIGRYARAKLPAMDASALAHFEALIAETDVDLNAWIFKPDASVDPAFADLITDVRAFHDLTEKSV